MKTILATATKTGFALKHHFLQPTNSRKWTHNMSSVEKAECGPQNSAKEESLKNLKDWNMLIILRYQTDLHRSSCIHFRSTSVLLLCSPNAMDIEGYGEFGGISEEDDDIARFERQCAERARAEGALPEEGGSEDEDEQIKRKRLVTGSGQPQDINEWQEKCELLHDKLGRREGELAQVRRKKGFWLRPLSHSEAAVRRSEIIDAIGQKSTPWRSMECLVLRTRYSEDTLLQSLPTLITSWNVGSNFHLKHLSLKVGYPQSGPKLGVYP